MMKKPRKPIENLSQKTKLSFWLLLASYASLQAAMATWIFVISPPKTASVIVIWLFQTFPLWLFFPGVLTKNTKNQLLLTLVLMVYFCIAVVNSFKSGVIGQYAVVESVLIVVLFTCASLNIRWQGRTNQLLMSTPTDS